MPEPRERYADTNRAKAVPTTHNRSRPKWNQALDASPKWALAMLLINLYAGAEMNGINYVSPRSWLATSHFCLGSLGSSLGRRASSLGFRFPCDGRGAIFLGLFWKLQSDSVSSRLVTWPSTGSLRIQRRDRICWPPMTSVPTLETGRSFDRLSNVGLLACA